MAKEGSIIFEKGYGYKEIDKNIPQKIDDIFRIASMTKAVTATAAMILFEEGKFELDDPLDKYLPEFTDMQILDTVDLSDSSFTGHPAQNKITIRQLFTHSSGIGYGFQDDKLMALYEKAGITEGFEERDILLADNVKRIATMPLMHEPGLKFTYGLNSDVLGRLVEVWSGQPLDTFFTERIFKPLGMRDTYFYLPETAYDRLTSVYMSSPEGIKPTDYPLIHYPVRGAKRYLSGGADLNCTIEDYYRFCRMLLNRGEWDGTRILKPGTVDLMTSTHLETGDYDMGLGFSVLSEKTTTTDPRSAGSFSGGGFFTTSFWIDPQKDLIGILFLQMYPFDDWGIQSDFERVVYESMVE